MLSTNEECSNKDLHSGTENKQSEFQKHRIMMGTMGSPRDKLLPLLIDHFRYIKIQHQTIHLSARLWGINTEFVGLIP